MTVDDLPKGYAMPPGKLHNHIVWCVLGFANYTDDMDDDYYFSHLNNAKYIRYYRVAIPVTSFQCDE
jgi:hypothetical protein